MFRHKTRILLLSLEIGVLRLKQRCCTRDVSTCLSAFSRAVVVASRRSPLALLLRSCPPARRTTPPRTRLRRRGRRRGRAGVTRRTTSPRPACSPTLTSRSSESGAARASLGCASCGPTRWRVAPAPSRRLRPSSSPRPPRRRQSGRTCGGARTSTGAWPRWRSSPPPHGDTRATATC